MAMSKLYFNRQVIVQVHDSGSVYQFQGMQKGDTFSIHFTVPFSNGSKPSSSTVTIMNISLKHRMLFSLGNQVDVFAGYKDNTGPQLLTTGLISVVNPYEYDGVDGTFSFIVREGANNSGKLPSKDSAKSGKSKKKKIITNAISFGKNISAKAVINRVASDAQIKLNKVKLAENKKFAKGYVAKGVPMDIIIKLAKECGSILYYRRGKIYIEPDDNSSAKNEHVYLSDKVKGTHGGSGLIAIPTVTGDGTPQIEVKALLLPQISTNSLIAVNGYQFNFIRPVKSGQHNCDDDDFSTTMECDIS